MADETVLQKHALRFIFLISRPHDKIEVDSINIFAKTGERKQRFLDQVEVR